MALTATAVVPCAFPVVHLAPTPKIALPLPFISRAKFSLPCHLSTAIACTTNQWQGFIMCGIKLIWHLLRTILWLQKCSKVLHLKITWQIYICNKYKFMFMFMSICFLYGQYNVCKQTLRVWWLPSCVGRPQFSPSAGCICNWTVWMTSMSRKTLSTLGLAWLEERQFWSFTFCLFDFWNCWRLCVDHVTFVVTLVSEFFGCLFSRFLCMTYNNNNKRVLSSAFYKIQCADLIGWVK